MSPNHPLTPAQVLAAGGVLSRVLPGYEPRASQVEMAEQVEAALAERRPLLCEAGTGTGKTLAYLVPAILSGQRVVISTGTRHLQEQLFHKDLPLLERALPTRFTAVRLKGIANYLCLRRFEEARQRPQPPPGLPRIIDWQARTEVGDRAEIPDLSDDAPEWLAVSATSETRLGSRCPFFEQCFVTRARRAAQGAELIIVNHHLLCADIAIRARFPEARLLPAYEALICDEAHQLEEIATDYFGTSVSQGRLQALLRDLRARGASTAAQPIEVHSQRLFAVLAPLTGASARPEGEPARVGLHAEHVSGEAAAAHLDLDSALEAAAAALPAEDEDQAQQFARRVHALRDDLALIIEGAARPGGNQVFWLEGDPSHLTLHASPTDVAGLLRRRLYAEVPALVFTSATLAPGGRFDFVRHRLGLAEDAPALRLPSPFDYRRQALLYLPGDLPEPADPSFLPLACDRIEELVHLTGGRAFLLFTSYGRMRSAYERLRRRLGGYPLLQQGDAPKHLLVERFAHALRDHGVGGVLFATTSFWEGVDVIGEALQLVVMDKLPFLPPDDPVLAARCRRLEEEHLDPFALYQVPRAALALAQGFGRLIRHRNDRGVVALLDRRAATRGYGPNVLSGLPPDCPRTDDLRQVAAFWAYPPSAPA